MCTKSTKSCDSVLDIIKTMHYVIIMCACRHSKLKCGLFYRSNYFKYGEKILEILVTRKCKLILASWPVCLIVVNVGQTRNRCVSWHVCVCRVVYGVQSQIFITIINFIINNVLVYDNYYFTIVNRRKG